MNDADGVPNAYALLTRDRELEVWQWRVLDCPYCHQEHTHGAGYVYNNPRKSLDVRMALCRMLPGVRYRLVEMVIEEVDDGASSGGAFERR